MTTYKVKITEVYTREIEVQAENGYDAYDKVDAMINDGEIDLPCDGDDYDYKRELEVKEKDKSKTEQLILRAEELEASMSSDEEIEIDLMGGNIWISMYSEAKGSWDGIEKFCKEDEINLDLLRELCNKRHWYYVL